MKRLFAGILLTVLFAPSLTSAGETSMSPEDKLAAGDDSVVVTWSAADAATSGGAEEAQAGISAAPTASNLQFVAFSAACRFLDTRIAGGAFARNESRDLGVLDASIPVGLGPCGVPARAKAVLLSLSALKGTTTAVGSAKVGPGGGATIMALQFQKALGSTATTVVPLNASSQVRITSAAAGAGYVGDLLGYYQAPVWGRVAANGTLTAGSGVTSITKSGTYLGDYYVYIDRTVSPSCAPAVMLETNNVRAFGLLSSSYVYVDVRDYLTTSEADGAFSFVLQCN